MCASQSESSSLCVLLSFVCTTHFCSVLFLSYLFECINVRPKENQQKSSFSLAEQRNRKKTVFANKLDFSWTFFSEQALTVPNIVVHQLIVRFVVETSDIHKRLEQWGKNTSDKIVQHLQRFNRKIQTATHRRKPADDFTVHTRDWSWVHQKR